ncbi:MAG: transcriptional regulator [Alcanivorax borkumensis]|jgi:cob(I)alamin adenosyltransferase|uniref:Alginate biosynthesis transcriptional activator n=1 Tax=Alcanivorax borkumensis (strain ATCC 700651 / DSM 11573 / NCIMB 13689 / SK2) TaxID=393595 RepID=Q0VMN3_ALCBS|nr:MULTISPECIES: Arc family DNA-binding protein [Alcanivorax]OJH08229.1 MAG: transcriptional regulator [Alcanivorax borkumensis]EUC68552.1 alginate regulatory protein [Alcanivorax sp. 97CO-5]PKG00951.1 Arc family DNA-binding protein [Alcanivorax sp. 97CO-6]CAL17565.1 alginate biosynthesis transcriptional activator [Alcanivorax borkumensis SK2]BAP15017.1 alginate biosynthesis transcriptional activator [Alcanivorax sp. NBRC 101098]
MTNNATTRTEKFVVRFPYGMRNQVAEAANDSHRSMNAEIIARLEHSLDNWPQTLPHTETPVPQGNEETALLERFRQLSRSKQQALLALLD